MKVTLPTKYNAASPRSRTGVGSATTIVGRLGWVISRATNYDVRRAPAPVTEAPRMGLIGIRDVTHLLPVVYGPRRFTLRKGRPLYANALRTPIS